MSQAKLIFTVALLLTIWGCSGQQSSEAPEATPASDDAPVAVGESGGQAAAPSAPVVTERAAPRTEVQPSESRTTAPAAPAPETTAPETTARSFERDAAPAVEPPPTPTVRTALIPSGTSVEIRLSDPVSSAVNQSGDTFEAILDSDLVVDGRVLIPRGSIMMGRLSNVSQSGRVEGRATLSMSLTEIQVRGDSYPIRTNTLAFEAEGTQKKDATKIGIGAGIGALVGAIAGGGKGAAIGAAVGGGAGTATVLATRGQEVEFTTEELFSFSLRDDLQVKLPQ